jgi:hypothetical protein
MALSIILAGLLLGSSIGIQSAATSGASLEQVQADSQAEIAAAYAKRPRGSAETAFSSYRSHDQTFSTNWQVTARQNFGSSVSAILQTNDTRLGDDNSKQYAGLKQYSTGFQYTGLTGDVGLWIDQYRSHYSFGGYHLNSRYYVGDQTSLAFEVQRSPVLDLDTLGITGRTALMTNNYTVRAERSVGTDKQYQASLSQGFYSDNNKNKSYSLQFSQTIYDSGWDRLQLGAYWYQAKWDKISEWYGNPLTSKSYGLTANYRINDGKGYWLTTLNGVWGADDNNPIEFWPSLQLQYGYEYSPDQSLVIGTAYGLRTDKANELEGLRHNYRQFSVMYQANW